MKRNTEFFVHFSVEKFAQGHYRFFTLASNSVRLVTFYEFESNNMLSLLFFFISRPHWLITYGEFEFNGMAALTHSYETRAYFIMTSCKPQNTCKTFNKYQTMRHINSQASGCRHGVGKNTALWKLNKISRALLVLNLLSWHYCRVVLTPLHNTQYESFS